MDVPLIEDVARSRPDWHWVFIGTKSNLVQISAPNVHFLGPKPYAELPRYLRAIDVCVLPWRQNHEFTSYGSAIKVREYLASGKPVVISPLPEYESMSNILRIARSREQFFELVDDALRESDVAQVQARQDAVRDGTWDARAEWVSGLIEEKLATKMREHAGP